MHCWLVLSSVYPVPQAMLRRQAKEPIVFSQTWPCTQVLARVKHSFISEKKLHIVIAR